MKQQDSLHKCRPGGRRNRPCGARHAGGGRIQIERVRMRRRRRAEVERIGEGRGNNEPKKTRFSQRETVFCRKNRCEAGGSTGGSVPAGQPAYADILNLNALRETPESPLLYLFSPPFLRYIDPISGLHLVIFSGSQGKDAPCAKAPRCCGSAARPQRRRGFQARRNAASRDKNGLPGGRAGGTPPRLPPACARFEGGSPGQQAAGSRPRRRSCTWGALEPAHAA